MFRAAAMLGAFVMTTTAGRAETTTIPFRYIDHELLVDVRLNGRRPYAFLIDSGTAPSVIDINLARRLDIPVSNRPAHGVDITSQPIHVYPATLQNVALGTMRIARIQAVAANISAFTTRLKTPVAGVLGGSFFDGRVTRIDYHCRTISVATTGGSGKPTVRVTKDPLGYIYTDDAWIGKQRVRAMFDTGNSGTIVVTGTGIAHLHLQNAARTGKIAESYGYLGLVQQTEGTLRDVRIGNLALGTMPARFLPVASDQLDVNFGNRTFERFIIALDYVRGTLTLSPPRACATAR
jgi:predicted aspartyl protease